MSIFTDYLKTRQQQRDGDWGIPQPSPAQPAAPQQPLVSQPAPQQPQVDTNNAMASIADMMGPTPVEREAQERKLQKQRAQWAAWTGVFDGLRQLGNLYYTYKGATPQKFDNPYTALNSEIQQQRAIQDNLNNYRRNYATSLYNMQRQMNQDKRLGEEHQAKLDWSKNRDDQNAEKVAIQKFKAETDRDYKNATIEMKQRINDINANLLSGKITLTEAQTELARARAANVGATTQTTKQTNPDGSVTTTKVTGGRGGTRRKRGRVIPGYTKSGDGNATSSTRKKGKLYNI